MTWFVATDNYLTRLRVALGLSANEMNALLALRTEGPYALSDLAVRIEISRPALTAMVERLDRLGWVQRSGHDGDRRKVIVDLTERFDREFGEVSTAWRHRVRNHVSASETWHTTRAALSELTQIARRSSGDFGTADGLTRPNQ